MIITLIKYALPALPAAAAIGLALRNGLLVAAGHRTVGIVSDVWFNRRVQQARIHFTANGSQHQFCAASWRISYAVGEEVRVLYLPVLPSVVVMDNWFELWGAPSMVGLAAVVLAGLLWLV